MQTDGHSAAAADAERCKELFDELEAHMTKQFIIRIFLGAIFIGNTILFISCHDSVVSNDVRILGLFYLLRPRM